MPPLNGYIALYRSLLEWEWYNEPNTCRVFIHCLLKANWKDMSHRGKLVERGCFLTSLDLLALQTGLSVRNVRTAIKNLKMTNELTVTTSSQGTEIKVNNYNKYQSVTGEATNELTGERQASDKQVTTSNKDNKDNKEINNKPPKKPATTKTILNSELTLSDEWKKLAEDYWSEKKRNDLSATEEFFKFKNNHIAKGSKMADWKRAWANWYSNAVTFNKPSFQIISSQQPQYQANFQNNARQMPKAGSEQ